MEDKECRVCREDEDSEDNKLYAPCLCSGSILFCHEKCLVEWLKRSGKDHCELCKTTYVFRPKFAPNTPEVLPRTELLVGIARMVMTKFVPQVFRVIVALGAWLVVMPCITTGLYRSLVFRFSAAQVGAEMSRAEYIYSNAVSGWLLTGLIIFSFIVMMSFGDFVRSYWTLTNNNRQQQQQQQQQQENAAQQEGNNVQVPRAEQDRRLRELRRQINAQREPVVAAGAAVFAGGEEGDIQQHEQEQQRQPDATVDRNDMVDGTINMDEEVQEWRARAVDREWMTAKSAMERRQQEQLEKKQEEELPLSVTAKSSSSEPLKTSRPTQLTPAAELPSITASSKLASGADVWAADDILADEHLFLHQKLAESLLDIEKKGLEEEGEKEGYVKEETDGGRLSEQRAYEERWAEKERSCGSSDDSIDDFKQNFDEDKEVKAEIFSSIDALMDSLSDDNSHVDSDDEEEDDSFNDNIEYEEEIFGEVEEDEEEEEAGPVNGILQALGLNDLQLELEMEMGDGDMGGAGGLLIDDEAQEEERLRVLQAEERRQELARLRHEEQQEGRRYDLFVQQQQQAGNMPNVIPPPPFPPPPAPAPPAEGGGGGAVGAADNGLELRLNVVELMGLGGPVSTMLRCVAWMLLFNAVCIFVGFSIPSFFGYLTTRNPAKGLLRVATLGQADFLVQLASGGRWVSVPALWEGVLATSATAGVDSSGSVLWSWAGWLLQRGAASHQQAMQFLERASATQNLITVPDLLVITAGYLVFILDSCFLSLLASLLASRLSRGDFRRLGRNVSLLLDFVKVMVDIVKIGVLLSTRIFLLPCVVGFVIYQCWNSFLFGYQADMLVNFCINNIVGAVGVLWGMGISFMLYSTIAILQLREILHPSFLARFIRPQESQSDLLASLLNDSSFVQIKRLVISFLVYLLLIGSFVYLPLLLVQTLGGELLNLFSPELGGVQWTSARVGEVLLRALEVRTHYLAPELQIPLEVGLLHTAFLMFLEKFKNVIGSFEFHTLVFLSKKLGLNRFLLPYTYKKIAPLSKNARCLADLAPSLQHLYRDREVLVVGDSVVVVCAEPMLRPPAGWDARVRESTTRWAWEADATFPLEKSVLPNVFPGSVTDMGASAGAGVDSTNTNRVDNTVLSFLWRWGTIFATHPGFGLRLLVLVLLCWLLTVGGALVPALFPFVLGRAVLFALRLPTFCCHDPLAFFVGNFAMQRIILGIEQVHESVYGRLCILVWNWTGQRLLLPSPDDDVATVRSRESRVQEGHEKSGWRLARELLLTGVFGCCVLPLCIGLAYNAVCMLLQPLALGWWSSSSDNSNNNTESCVSQSELEPLSDDLLSLLVQWVLGWQQGQGKGHGLLLLKELTRTMLFGQMALLVFVILVLSRRLKTLLAAVGISVLRADVEGPPSPEEIQEQEEVECARRGQPSVFKWYLLFWEEQEKQEAHEGRFRGWVRCVKDFEWEVDYFAAAFVRCSPGSVMQDHLMVPRPVRTEVTTLTPQLLVHHFAEMTRLFNKVFIFSPQACWFLQYVVGSHLLALIPLALRVWYFSDNVVIADSSGSYHSELRVLLPLLVVGGLCSWLDAVLGAVRIAVRGGTRLVQELQQRVKEDSYLVGKELQNSAEGLRHMASLSPPRQEQQQNS